MMMMMELMITDQAVSPTWAKSIFLRLVSKARLQRATEPPLATRNSTFEIVDRAWRGATVFFLLKMGIGEIERFLCQRCELQY